MKRWIAALALVATVVGVPQAARAIVVDWDLFDDPLRVDVTNSSYFIYHTDNGDDRDDNDDFFSFMNRLNLDLSVGDYTLGGRFDTAVFPDAPADRYQSDWFRAEKVYLRIDKRRVSVVVGDFYAAFGRGIALYVRKVDELSVDPTLRGAKVAYHDGPFALTVLGGLTNTLNVDDQTEELTEDPNDVVVGARASFDILGYVTPGVHGVLVLNRKDFPPRNDTAPQDRFVAGATLDVPDIARIFSFYGEFDYMRRTDMIYGATVDGGFAEPTYTEQSATGYAGYATASATIADLTARFEFRYYEDWMLVPTPGDGVPTDRTYVRPPTLERVRERNVENLGNSFGVRARLDYAFPTGTTVYANVMHLWDAPFDEGRTLHVYGGVEQRIDDWGLLADVSGGWRWEQKPEPGDSGSLRDHRKMWHIDAEVSAAIYGPHSISVSFHDEEYEKPEFGDVTRFSIRELTVTYSFAPWVDASFIWGFTDELNYDQVNYFGGDVRVRFLHSVRALSSSYVRVFAGAKKGGLTCVNGMCRNEPAFEGVRGDVVLRF